MSDPAEVLAQNAGARLSRRARSTGTVVTLYRGEEAGLDTDDGREAWSTVCEDHGTIVCHATRRTAASWLSHPEDWCEACMEACKGRAKPGA